MSLRKHTRALVLFPAKAPLEAVAMDLLGPFLRSPRGNTHLLVITDRYSKLTRTVPMRKTDGFSVAKAFVHDWVFTYGPPRSVLTDNGPPFSGKFLQSACGLIGIRNLFTTTYNPKANGQAERYNRTLGAALRAYVADNLTDWDIYAPAITFAYNTQVHTTTGLRPFDLVLSRDIPSMTLEAPLQEEVEEARLVRTRWLKKLESFMRMHQRSTRKAQARYKRNFDKRLRNQTHLPEIGSFVYVRRDYQRKPTGAQVRSRKLAPRADGPYLGKEILPTTAVIQIGDQTEYISFDRLAPAPAPTSLDQPGPSIADLTPGQTSEQQFVVDRIVNHRFLRKKVVAEHSLQYEYRVLWYDGKTTWEPIEHLPRHFVVQYCRRKKIALPDDLDRAEVG